MPPRPDLSYGFIWATSLTFCNINLLLKYQGILWLHGFKVQGAQDQGVRPPGNQLLRHTWMHLDPNIPSYTYFKLKLFSVEF